MFLKYPEDLVDQLFKLMVVVSSLSSIPCTSRALVGQFLLLGHRAVDLFVHHVFGLPRGPCRPLPAHLCYPMDLAGAKILAIFRRLHLDRVVSNPSRNGQKGHAVLNFSGRGRPGRDPGLQKSRLESKTLTPQFVFFPPCSELRLPAGGDNKFRGLPQPYISVGLPTLHISLSRFLLTACCQFHRIRAALFIAVYCLLQGSDVEMFLSVWVFIVFFTLNRRLYCTSCALFASCSSPPW